MPNELGRRWETGLQVCTAPSKLPPGGGVCVLGSGHYHKITSIGMDAAARYLCTSGNG